MKKARTYFLYAFVAPNNAINRMFETEQPNEIKPELVTQVKLTEEQHDQVWEIRKQGKRAALVNGSVVELIE